MTSQNEEAEELMRRVEKEEEREADPDKQAALAPCHPPSLAPRHHPGRPTHHPTARHHSSPAHPDPPDTQMFHLCIINLVIGTLYCAKGNFEFGIGRVMKALEPYPKKLGTDTWFYAKRTFLALAETLAKHMIMLKDATYTEIFAFLDAVDLCGKAIPTKVQDHPDRPVDTEKCNVSFEARLIKKMYIRLQHA